MSLTPGESTCSTDDLSDIEPHMLLGGADINSATSSTLYSNEGSPPQLSYAPPTPDGPYSTTNIQTGPPNTLNIQPLYRQLNSLCSPTTSQAPVQHNNSQTYRPVGQRTPNYLPTYTPQLGGAVAPSRQLPPTYRQPICNSSPMLSGQVNYNSRYGALVTTQPTNLYSTPPGGRYAAHRLSGLSGHQGMPLSRSKMQPIRSTYLNQTTPMGSSLPAYSTSISSRRTPYMGQPDIRIHELNKRLQQRCEDSDNVWWDNFATEFFEDDATLTLSFCLEDGPKRYTIGRVLIPRYFRSIFEGGVTDLYYMLKEHKESFHNTTISLDCDQAMMITHHGKPMFTKVVTEGRLIIDFTFDDLFRIRSWHFATRQHRELIPRSVIAMQQDPAMVEQLSKNITRQGLTSYTLNFLRLCVILEPMQELMSRHKAYGLTPRDCLKTTLFQKWQRIVSPPGFSQPKAEKKSAETARPSTKRRKRKGSTPNNSSNAGGKKRSPAPQPFNNLVSTVPGDVMVVGEPTLMGGEFGDDDERLITRLENSQYDTKSSQDHGQSGGTPKQDYTNSPMHGGSPWGAKKSPGQTEDVKPPVSTPSS